MYDWVIEYIPWIISITSLIVVILIGYNTIRISRKQQYQNALTDVFHLLNTKNNKDAEDELIKEYKKNGEKNLYKDNEMNDWYLKNCCDIIRRNYFKVGILISEDVVPPYPFYIIFGYKLVQLYAICQREIKSKQQETPDFASHFTNLAIDCLNFYHDNAHEEDNKVKDVKTGKQIPRDKFGIKITIIENPKKSLLKRFKTRVKNFF